MIRKCCKDVSCLFYTSKTDDLLTCTKITCYLNLRWRWYLRLHVNKNNVFYAFLGVILCGAGGFLIYDQFSAKDFYYAGTLEATRVVVPARVGSQILKFDVLEGDRLEKGQIIATLDDTDLKITLKNIKSKYDRGLFLYQSGRFTKTELETLEAEKDGTELKIHWCQIAAPISGKVLSKYKEVGEWASPGGGMLSMADLQKIWAFFYVEQEQVVHLALGQDVTGILPELPGRVFHGRIIKINDEPEFTPKNVQTREERTRLVYGIKVQFENADEALKPGMTIETTFGRPPQSSQTTKLLEKKCQKKALKEDASPKVR